MITHCKNCGAGVQGRHCSNCGQKTSIHRFSWHTLWHEYIHFFTHADHGFLHTTKEIVLRPGKTIYGILNGQRIRHQQPISFFLLWISIYLLLTGLYFKYLVYIKEASVTGSFTFKYFTILIGIMLPVLALFIFLIAGIKRLNYVECLVAMLYLLGLGYIINSVILLFAALFSINIKSSTFLLVSNIIVEVCLIIALYDFLKRCEIPRLILRLIIGCGIAVGLYQLYFSILIPLLAKKIGS
jgi:Protein of unknown function (DUF3667)